MGSGFDRVFGPGQGRTRTRAGALRRILVGMALLLLVFPTSACLGTVVRSPHQGFDRQTTTQVHLIAAPRELDASICRDGFAEVATFVPVWGVVVGYLTFGIIVPVTTSYTCMSPR